MWGLAYRSKIAALSAPSPKILTLRSESRFIQIPPAANELRKIWWLARVSQGAVFAPRGHPGLSPYFAKLGNCPFYPRSDRPPALSLLIPLPMSALPRDLKTAP